MLLPKDPSVKHENTHIIAPEVPFIFSSPICSSFACALISSAPPVGHAHRDRGRRRPYRGRGRARRSCVRLERNATSYLPKTDGRVAASDGGRNGTCLGRCSSKSTPPRCSKTRNRNPDVVVGVSYVLGGVESSGGSLIESRNFFVRAKACSCCEASIVFGVFYGCRS